MSGVYGEAEAGGLQAKIAARVAATVGAQGPELARRAFEAGLAVTRPDSTRVPIPIGAIPVVLPRAEIARRCRLAALLVSAQAKAASCRLAGQARLQTLDALGASERRLVLANEGAAPRLAVARVDFLGSPPAVLEVNATIPAMQGYSDIAARAWLETFAGDDAAALAAANGSNADALFAALVDLHRRARGRPPERVGLLARSADAQQTELAYLAGRFATQGVEAVCITPEDLQFERESLYHAGRPLCVVYRHLFLSRLDAAPCPALEAALRPRDRGTLVLNPPAPHLEMKATLALLSRAVEHASLAAAIGLSDDELDAVARHVPWTRRLDSLSAGESDAVAANPDDYVLKRSWSYGGLDVFLGRSRGEPGFAERAARLYPASHDWPALLAEAARDRRGDGFVVQRAVRVERRGQWMCTPTQVHASDTVTDYSAYASLGTSPDWSGVCRAATSDVVNIVGGGGVVPLLYAEVAERWLRSRD